MEMAKKPEVKINKAAARQLEREIAEKLPPLRIPTQGSEAEAVADVKKQLKDAGVKPNDSMVRKAVRKARE